MILTVKETAAIGKPCAVFDADGKLIPFIVEVDTETGRALRQLRDENGQPVFHRGTDDLKMEEAYHPAPLRVEWCDPICENESHRE